MGQAKLRKTQIATLKVKGPRKKIMQKDTNLSMDEEYQQRIKETCTINISPVMQEIVPELIAQAVDAIEATKVVITNLPKYTAEFNKLLDLKLAIIKETYICNRIKNRVDGGGKAWTQEEKQQAVRLITKQYEHNALVRKLSSLTGHRYE